jgi:hypothetical protein
MKKKFIVQVYESKRETITTVELILDSLSEVESNINKIFNGWAVILSVVITTN